MIGENVKGASISFVTHSNKEASWSDNVRHGRLIFHLFIYSFVEQVLENGINS